MHKPSSDAHLTADLHTCGKCGVTQVESALRQLYSAPALKIGTRGALMQVGADFKRGPDVPGEVESDAERTKRLNAPWECRSTDNCAKNKIEAALKQMHGGVAWHGEMDPIEAKLRKEMDKNLEKARKKLQARLERELKKRRAQLLAGVVKRARK